MKGVVKLKLELAEKHRKLDALIKENQSMKKRLGTMLATESARMAITYEPLKKGEWDAIKRDRDQLMPKSLTKGKDITWGDMWSRTANEVAAGLKDLSAAQVTILKMYLQHLYGEGKLAEDKAKAAKAGASQVALVVQEIPTQADPNREQSYPKGEHNGDNRALTAGDAATIEADQPRLSGPE